MISLRRNAIANLVGRLVTAILWIGATPFLLAQLGYERFGIWSLFFAFNAYLLWLDLGVGSTMLRFIAAQRPLRGRQALVKTLHWGLWAAVGLGLVWMVAVELSRGWIAGVFHVPPGMMPEALDALLIFGIGVLLIFPAQALMASLKGFERIDLSNLCMALGVGVHVLFLYINLSAGLGLRGAAWAGVAGQVVAGSLAFIMVRSELLKVSPHERGTGPTWRELVHFSAALQLAVVTVIAALYPMRVASRITPLDAVTRD
jgi:Na+-driven multidrug efflux pump